MKISVCMATYNGQKYISDQLCSIVTQLGNEDEIIISDDSSTDDTLEIINSLNDNRIRVLPGQKFGNTIYNLENAIKHSDGDIIILSDQDDVWLPGRVKQIVAELEKADLVLTDAYIVNEKLERQHKTLFESIGSKKGFFKNIIKNSYVGCCIAFNATIKKKIMPFPPNLPMHDQWIGLVAEMFYKVKFIPTPSVLYRRHGANVSNTGSGSTSTIGTKLKNRIRIFSAVMFYSIKR